MKKYTAEEIASHITHLRGWEIKNEGIEKSFQFADFKAAFAAMTHIALEAEVMNHHPEWFNVYNRLNVRLSTHDAGGVTDLDIQLAERIEAIVT